MKTCRTSSQRALLRLTLLLACAALLPLTAAASVLDWELVSPDGGTLVQLVRGADPATVYAVSEPGGLFVSLDGGQRWDTLAQHIGRRTIRAVGAPPDDVDQLLVSTGMIQRSVDGGLTWETVAGPAFVNGFAFAPSDPDRVYAYGYGYGNDLWRSDDGGASWTELDQPARDVVVDPRDADRLWAGHSRGVEVSEDGGLSWEKSLDSVDVFDLAVDQGDPLTLWAGATDGLWVSEDEGESWQRHLPPGPHRPAVRHVIARPGLDGQALAIASRYQGASSILLADSVFRVALGGSDWQLLSERPVSIEAILGEVDRPGTFVPGLLAPRGQGVVEGPVRRSGFVTPIGLRATVVTAFDVPELAPSTLYGLDDSRFDLLTSEHGGRLWERRPLTSEDLRVAPSDPKRLYSMTSSSLRRSSDGGATFEESPLPLPTGVGFYHSLAIDPADPDVLRLVMRFESSDVGICHGRLGCSIIEYRLFASEDGGESWRPVDTPGAPETPIEDFLFDPRAEAGEPTLEYLLSFDDLWVRDPAAGGGGWVSVRPTSLSNAAQLVAQRTKGEGLALYVRTDLRNEKLWRSLDGGESWGLLDAGLPEDGVASAAAAAPRPGGRVVLAIALQGIFELVDGVRWEKLGQGVGDSLDGLVVERLAVAAGSDVVFALWNGRLYRHGVATDCTPPAPGEPSSTLCLGEDGRYRVEVDWQDFQGGFGAGTAEPLTPDAGYFWFFRQANAELAVKVLDGTGVNGNHWVFYGALTNVPFDLTVTDTVTCDYRTYSNPSRNFASHGDTAAFPEDGFDEPPVAGLRAAAAAPAATTVGCGTEPGVLCLHDGRFRIEADWENFQGGSGAATAATLSTDSGYLWFFDPDNVELFVKVLDGRPVNGHWWVFYGSLSNVRFELRVTDVLSGVTRTYENPSRTFASRGDVTAFDGP